MDLQSFVDGWGAMTCVISVENLGNGRYGEIRIVTGNQAYIDSIEKPVPGVQMLVSKFEPNSLYTKYFPKDLNFEQYSYRAAVEKKCLHSYAKPERMDIWFNMTFLPVAYEEGNLCYCTYTMEIDHEPDSERLSNMSADIAGRVLETCITLRGSHDFNHSMQLVIDDIRDLCKADHCAILLLDSYERKCNLLCESYDPAVRPSLNDFLDDKFYDIADTWKDVIAGSNCIIVRNEQDMEVVRERSPLWYESLTGAKVDSIVLFPLKFRDELLGYIWALNFDPDYSSKIKEVLETTTFILSSEINNYLLLDRLKILSSKDMLTGVMNRNEMNNYVEKLSNGKGGTSVGVIFADLNGLKRINDDYGHPAGDKLLKDAAKALEEVFRADEIFRAGGDEFTIISIGITEEELNSRADKIREVSEKYDDLVFALGVCYDSDKNNVRMALRLADERMYADKKEYYKNHPEKKRT
jgi:diguanylate cyclase (GGDEF)-like protein